MPVRIEYQYVFPVPGVKPMLVPTTIQDRWVKQDGVWYHVLDTSVIPVPEKNAKNRALRIENRDLGEGHGTHRQRTGEAKTYDRSSS